MSESLDRTFDTLGEPACVALFAYMRPDHLRQTVESLLANPEAARTRLNVFCDAPKHPEHAPGVEDVRRYVDTICGFASISVTHRPSNFGLARSIIDGVSTLLAMNERVIVLEDDLLLSPHFLRYMNDALECYAGDDIVASIHGYCYPTRDALPETFFLRGADCWGWATWRRAWTHFRPDGAALLAELQTRKLAHEFDMDGSYPYTQMLRDQIAGRNDSWAVRWHASAFLRGMLTLYPGSSLVHNIGNDASGTHCAESDEFSQVLAKSPINLRRIPLESPDAARAAFVRFFRKGHDAAPRRLLRLMRRITRRLA